MNKTWQIVRFEVMRNLKKPSFWIAAMLIPILFAIYIGIAALAGYTAEEKIGAGTDTSDMKLAVFDEAEYLSLTKFVNTNGAEQSLIVYEDKTAGIDDVKAGKIDVLYYIPKTFAENPLVEIYTKPDHITLLDDYTAPMRSLLTATAAENVASIDFAIISDTVAYNTTSYDQEDNHVVDMSESISKIIAPAIALATFYILIVVLGNRIIAAMTEEKENRISEIILTNINPTKLITGKIISLMILGIIQLTILVVPVIIFLKYAATKGALPFDISIQIDPVGIIKYIALLIMSYFLFTALCVSIGAVSPTAKDANSFSAVVIILTILPIFFISSFATSPEAITYILSYFPPSAPIALMLRGAFGNLQEWELWVGLADITISGILIARLAAHLFKNNAIEFNSKINLKKLIGNPRTTWKQ